MRFFFTSFFSLLLCFSSFVFAQSTIVKGKVLNDSGKPIVGITVTVKDTKLVTITDSTGLFSIATGKLPARLVFTGVGYEQFEQAVTDRNLKGSIEIRLHDSSDGLAEVVVVGYGSDKKSFVSLEGISDKAAGISTKRADPGRNKVLKKEMVLRKTAPDTVKANAKSRVLTAGELSDFKKWKLWGDYTESEFKSWSEHWGMAPKKRYCVQVQNGDHRAVVGEKVYLVDNHKKDTVWYAVTDNTGKAELWAKPDKDEEDQAVYSIVCGREVIRFPTIFERGINRITLKKACDLSTIADVAFVVDATGSMGDEIRYLQEELQDVIGKIAEKYKDVNLYIGSVFYRDRGDEYLTRHIDFQTDPSQLINFLQKQAAGGGGDGPEAVEDALTTALDSLHWHGASRSKILFLVLDAPPHDAAKNKMIELTKQAARKGIRIVPVVCSGIDKSTEYLMRSIALTTNGSYVFLTDDSGVGNPHIKPTTDEFKVELLNDLLQRLIGEMIYVAACNERQANEQPIDLLVNNHSKVVVYPNPTKGRIQIQSSEAIKEMFLTDFTGKLLMKHEVSNKKGKWDIDLSAYPSGIYLVKYFKEDKGWGSEKVVLLR